MTVLFFMKVLLQLYDEMCMGYRHYVSGIESTCHRLFQCLSLDENLLLLKKIFITLLYFSPSSIPTLLVFRSQSTSVLDATVQTIFRNIFLYLHTRT